MTTAITKCDGCGLESANEKLFKSEKEPFCKRKTLCLWCQRKKEQAILWRIWWAYCAFGLLGIGLAWTHPGLAFGGWLLNMGFLLAAGVIDTTMHEAGHAFAGKAVGMRVFSAEVGSGKVLLELKWAGVRWRFRTLLFGGLAWGAPRNVKWQRLRQTIFTLGGPAANAILALAAWIVLPWDSVLRATRFAGFAPMRMLLLSNGIALVFSLWPRRVRSTQGRKIANDGLRLWLTWQQKPEQREKNVAFYYAMEVAESLREERFGEAEGWLGRGLKEFPSNALLKCDKEFIRLRQNRLKEAREGFSAWLKEFPDEKALAPTVKNNVAFLDALLDQPEWLEEADKLSQEALGAVPGNNSFKGTRGFVLARLGRHDEGVALMEEAMRTHVEKSAQAANAFCLAVAAEQRGLQRESEEYFALARKLDPKCHLLEWAERKKAMAMVAATRDTE